MKSIVLYGLKSEKEAYQCTRYEILGCERMSVTDLLFTASDNYREAIREGHTEQDSIDFKLYLEQVGVRVY